MDPRGTLDAPPPRTRTIAGFSLRQLASLLVVGTVAAFLAPAGVQAATNIATIVGPGSSSQADGVRVDNHRLRVGDGSGPLSVDGVVAARPALPRQPWMYTVQSTGSESDVLFDAPGASSRLAVSTVTVTNGSSSATAELLLMLHSGPNCTGSTVGPFIAFVVPPDDMRSISYPAPLVYGPRPADWSLCVHSNGSTASTTATGWYS